jgi:hypothetical protein
VYECRGTEILAASETLGPPTKLEILRKRACFNGIKDSAWQNEYRKDSLRQKRSFHRRDPPANWRRGLAYAPGRRPQLATLRHSASTLHNGAHNGTTTLRGDPDDANTIRDTRSTIWGCANRSRVRAGRCHISCVRSHVKHSSAPGRASHAPGRYHISCIRSHAKHSGGPGDASHASGDASHAPGRASHICDDANADHGRTSLSSGCTGNIGDDAHDAGN